MKAILTCLRKTMFGLVAWGFGALAAGTSVTHAAGLLIADGGWGGVMEIKTHEVQVTINNGIAVTKVTQVFHNTENRQVEALYTFPVPQGASVANFSMWINGKEMVGEVLEKKRARQIYESYKQTRRDPGLLEQVDYRTFEMRIFPIPPQADQKVQLTYYQELEYDHDWANYVYPLATVTRRGVEARTTGKFSVTVDLKAVVPIKAVESPSHGPDMVIAKHTDNYYQASLETTGGSLARDFVLAGHLSRPHTGLDLVTSKTKGEEGYFCLMLTLGEELGQGPEGMDYVFVLDASGSMADDGKLLVSQESLAAFINALGAEDRFEVMAFNVQPYVAFHQLRPAALENKRHAQAFLSSQVARGGTVLNPAMNTAYKYATADRPLNVVILSDGLTEQKERQTLFNLIQSRPRQARVFCVGVGNDVDRPLLEQLAEDSGGLAAFISSGDNFERQAKAFRRKLVRPAATDLQLEFNGLAVRELVPRQLPNLYHGRPVRVYGRYHGEGQATVRVQAKVNGQDWKQELTLNFPAQDLDHPEIDRMWAWHRIDALQKQADRVGNRASVVEEIVRLGEAYSIVSEYTSFLVLENDAEYQRWQVNRQNLRRFERDREAQQRWQAQLESLRNKALADLGPQNEPTPSRELAQASATKPVSSSAPASIPTPSTAPPRPQRQSQDFSFGSGPVGPLFVGLLAMLAGLRRRWGQPGRS